jgi:hypothetical protein
LVFILFHTDHSTLCGKKRGCRSAQNALQTFLQRNAVPGKAGVYHEIAAAEAVRIFDLADKGGNAFFLGKIFVYGFCSSVSVLGGW